jgi:hypothetical protein
MNPSSQQGPPADPLEALLTNAVAEADKSPARDWLLDLLKRGEQASSADQADAEADDDAA